MGSKTFELLKEIKQLDHYIQDVEEEQRIQDGKHLAYLIQEGVIDESEGESLTSGEIYMLMSGHQFRMYDYNIPRPWRGDMSPADGL